MNEKDLLKTIKLLKKLLFGISTAAILGIGGEFLMAMKVGITNKTEVQNIKEKQTIQQQEINKKADLTMVKAVKENLEKQIVDKISTMSEQVNGLKGQLDIVIQMLPSVTYNYKPTTNNKK